MFFWGLLLFFSNLIQVSILTVVPTILNFMLSTKEFKKDNFGHLEHIISGAAPVPPSSVAVVREMFGENFFMQHGKIWGTLFFKKIYMKKFKIRNKDNKIYHGRGNSLRNEVRGWVELDSPDPLKPLPPTLVKFVTVILEVFPTGSIKYREIK